jgi:hypothetical protein
MANRRQQRHWDRVKRREHIVKEAWASQLDCLPFICEKYAISRRTLCEWMVTYQIKGGGIFELACKRITPRRDKGKGRYV